MYENWKQIWTLKKKDKIKSKHLLKEEYGEQDSSGFAVYIQNTNKI